MPEVFLEIIHKVVKPANNKVFPLALAVISFAASTLFYQAIASAETDNKGVLHGKIEHSENLEPVPGKLRIGSIWTGAISDDTTDNRWFKIPRWLTGSWKSHTQTTLADKLIMTDELRRKFLAAGDNPDDELAKFNKRSDKEPKTIENDDDVNWGDQKDSVGDAWVYAGRREEPPKDNGEKITYNFLLNSEVLESTDQTFNTRTSGILIVVNKTTNRIKYTVQNEMLHYLSPCGNGKIRWVKSKEAFDENGVPMMRIDIQADYEKTAEFAPNKSYGGAWPELFKAFLTSAGLSNLVPKQ